MVSSLKEESLLPFTRGLRQCSEAQNQSGKDKIVNSLEFESQTILVAMTEFYCYSINTAIEDSHEETVCVGTSTDSSISDNRQ